MGDYTGQPPHGATVPLPIDRERLVNGLVAVGYDYRGVGDLADDVIRALDVDGEPIEAPFSTAQGQVEVESELALRVIVLVHAALAAVERLVGPCCPNCGFAQSLCICGEGVVSGDPSYASPRSESRESIEDSSGVWALTLVADVYADDREGLIDQLKAIIRDLAIEALDEGDWVTDAGRYHFEVDGHE